MEVGSKLLVIVIMHRLNLNFELESIRVHSLSLFFFIHVCKKAMQLFQPIVIRLTKLPFLSKFFIGQITKVKIELSTAAPNKTSIIRIELYTAAAHSTKGTMFSRPPQTRAPQCGHVSEVHVRI